MWQSIVTLRLQVQTESGIRCLLLCHRRYHCEAVGERGVERGRAHRLHALRTQCPHTLDKPRPTVNLLHPPHSPPVARWRNQPLAGCSVTTASRGYQRCRSRVWPTVDSSDYRSPLCGGPSARRRRLPGAQLGGGRVTPPSEHPLSRHEADRKPVWHQVVTPTEAVLAQSRSSPPRLWWDRGRSSSVSQPRPHVYQRAAVTREVGPHQISAIRRHRPASSPLRRA